MPMLFSKVSIVQMTLVKEIFRQKKVNMFTVKPAPKTPYQKKSYHHLNYYYMIYY